MPKKHVTLNPRSNLPFCSAVVAGDYIFLSGTAATRDEKGEPLTTIEGQLNGCFTSMSKTLNSVGASISDIVKVTCFLRNQSDFAKMNEVYRSHFPNELPARSTIVTDLVVTEMLLEIECIAYKPR
jgi:2-iminobutanoate/2-iminopropanoate deaminase